MIEKTSEATRSAPDADDTPSGGGVRERQCGGRRRVGQLRLHPPLVSIVVVVFQAFEALPPLLDSIFLNRTDDTELIVIDGGSTDGTVDLLRKGDSWIDFWASEPDRGIYDAMNKGIAAATGDFILHLNAGDKLLQIPTARLRRCLEDATSVASFRVLMNRSYVFRPHVGLLMKIDNAWHHQGTFYRRSAHPGYDLRYRVFSDFDANQRLMLSGAKTELFEEIVAEHTTDGISSSRTRRHEVYHIIKSNFGLWYLFLASMRFSLNAIRRRVNAVLAISRRN